MLVCKCGSFKVENKELGLCATCNKARIKALKPAPVKKVYTLKKTPLKPAATRIPKVSTKHKSVLQQERELHKAMDAENIRWCESCGKTGVPLSRSHTIPKGMYPQFRLVRVNLMYECEVCHNAWEHGTLKEKQQLKSWEQKLQVIQQLSKEYLMKLFGH